MFRLTRLMFSPLTYFVLAGLSLLLAGFVMAAGLLGYGSMLGLRTNPSTDMVSAGVVFVLSAPMISASLVVAGIFMFAARGIVVEFWSETRPWLHYGPPPQTSREKSQVEQPLQTSVASAESTVDSVQHDSRAAERGPHV